LYPICESFVVAQDYGELVLRIAEVYFIRHHVHDGGAEGNDHYIVKGEESSEIVGSGSGPRAIYSQPDAKLIERDV
jgi:hypothetical protein